MMGAGLSYLNDDVSLTLNQAVCIGCGLCTQVCPHGVLLMEGKKATIAARGRCIECGACVRNCPVEALMVTPGVGCASAIIHGWLTGSEPSCDCGC